MFVLVSSVAFATSFAPPVTRDVWSPSGTARVHVDAHTRTWTVYLASDPGHVLWSFEHHVWHDDVSVSDGGDVVVIASWDYVSVTDLDRPGLEWWTREGSQHVPIQELVTHPGRVPIGPIGPHWRDWLVHIAFTPDEIALTPSGLWSYRYGWDGQQLGWGLSPLGVLQRGVGALGWALLLAVIGLASSERRAGTGTGRLVLVLLAAVPATLWLALYMGVVPLPAGLAMPLDWLMWGGGLLAMLPALVAALRTHWRRVWLVLLLLLGIELLTLPLSYLVGMGLLEDWLYG